MEQTGWYIYLWTGVITYLLDSFLDVLGPVKLHQHLNQWDERGKLVRMEGMIQVNPAKVRVTT